MLLVAVVAGSQVDASPYLTTTAASKFETKKGELLETKKIVYIIFSSLSAVVFKRTNPSHQAPKFKSPYHVSMAKNNKTKK